MNKLRKRTVTGVTLAVSCVLPGMALSAEASSTILSINKGEGSASDLQLSTASADSPSFSALDLEAIASTADTAKFTQLPHSALAASFSTETTADYQTQSDRLSAIALSNTPEPSEVPHTIHERFLPTASALEPTELDVAEPPPAVLEFATLETSHQLAQATDNTASPLSEQEIREQLLTTPNPVEAPEIDVLDRRPQPVPSSTFITPNAYGADWGDFYIGSAGATEDTDDGLDASASLGMGFGNAVENVGVELNVGIISIDGFAEDGTVGFKVHKIFPKANNLGVAVGWYNPITWGDARKDEDTYYGVVTQRFNLRPQKENPMPLTTSLGVGTGTFRSKGAVEAGDNAPNLFGSVGLRVIPQVSLVSSWSGRALGLAASAAPFNSLPFVFTAGVSDLTDNTEEGTHFVGGLGYSFGF